MIPAHISSFQVNDPKFAAAAVALGCPCHVDFMEHVPSGNADSQKHVTLHKTFHLGTDGVHVPKDLHAGYADGSLARENPAHPLFPALAAIESFERLRSPGGPLSLLPLFAKAFATGIQRACILRPSQPSDGNLNAFNTGTTALGMDTHFAAVAAVCGFGFLRTEQIHAGKFPVLIQDSHTFPGLELRDLCDWFMAFDRQTTATAPDALGRVEVAHTLPGAPAGEHAAHYALAAVRIYQTYTIGKKANRPNRFLFTGNFSALVPTDLDTAAADTVTKFVAKGGSVLLG
jgi:hypothetical protein